MPSPIAALIDQLLDAWAAQEIGAAGRAITAAGKLGVEPNTLTHAAEMVQTAERWLALMERLPHALALEAMQIAARRHRASAGSSATSRATSSTPPRSAPPSASGAAS
ncbi:MAG: hypothetical protein RQ833_07465 [Sphingomonadaceae bacterium]|nr:hypothetical protein [Sphingomonadaceae bacterium]